MNLKRRVASALYRIKGGHPATRVPAQETDADVVISDLWEALQAAQAELAALKTAQEWRGMESAPKDGTVVMVLLQDGSVRKSWYFAPSSMTRGWMTSNGDWIDPARWMPLPTPPQEQSHD